MRTFAERQHQPQNAKCSGLARPHKETHGPAHREHPLLRLQRSIGNQAVLRLLQNPAPEAIQTKLEISQPGDVYEQEADRVSEQVMARPAHSAVSVALPAIQRFSGKSNEQTEAAPASVDQTLASSGRPLEPAIRQDMEQRFGHDFSKVRVHTDAQASASAQSMDALAFTSGRDVVFGAGQYAPDTARGRRLLAHELTHVLQQAGQVTTTQTLQRQPSGSQQSKKTPAVGKIIAQFDQKVLDHYIWPNAWGSLDWVKSVAVGQEVWDQLIQGGAILTIKFVAEKTDIPIKSADTLGFYEESTGTVYVLVGQEDYQEERTAHGTILKKGIISRNVADISDTLFHELLHAWFTMVFPTRGMGHKPGATPLGDPKFDPKDYDQVFLARLQRFEKEFGALRAKHKRP